jgi:hypothetical protein
MPWQKDADEADGDAAVDIADVPADPEPEKKSAFTEGKGRPTPKRRDAEGRRRGPIAPAPQTRAEARARKKELKKASKAAGLTKEQKRELADKRRQARVDSRERMMAGDEKYLLPRDQGDVRRYARDLVDSRRNFAGMFMPFAIVLIVVMFVPALAGWVTIGMLIFAVFCAIDSVVLGRMVSKRVHERYPSSTDGGWRLGWYCFTRAMQMRRMRAPRPQVKPGEAV